MTLQHIRYYYEQPVVDWCADNTVELRVDNMLEPGGDAAGEFVMIRFNFGQMTEPEPVRPKAEHPRFIHR